MYTREFQLLLYCARSQPEARRIKAAIQQGISWQKLLELAQQHGVRPLLRQSLKSVCWDSVPQEIQHDLEIFHKAHAQASLLFAGELLRLHALFQQNGIPLATFKGVILGESVYGDFSLREFSDLDIIVHETDVAKAEDILTALGYQADFPDRDFRSAFLSYQGQYAFRNKRTGISVDLHWALSSKGAAFPLNASEVWPRVGQATICGRSVPTLAPDDLALFLAAHGTKEGWRVLKWVCDFAEFLHAYRDIDWVAVLNRAERCNSSRSVQVALVLAVTLLDAPGPPELINKAMNNFVVLQVAERARLRMLSTAHEGELREFLNSLNTHDRLTDRLWPIATLLTTRTVADYRAIPFPKSLWGIYYLTRPFRLANKAAQMIFRDR